MFKRIKYLTSVGFLIAFVLALSVNVASAKNIQDISLEAFFDNTMNSKLEKYHIPNATVSVVKDGKIVYKKGFGFADIENNIPVDADTTLFRIGSTSKLITWTAVMQLVEAGKLDLNTDINSYLDFEIPQQLEKTLKKNTTGPITMTHLMTHTPGFEDYPDMLFRLSEDGLMPLREYVKGHLPARIFPAGEVAAYSNYGTALAGYIVERLSGLPFSEYVEKNIFTPLYMNNSSFRQQPALYPPALIAKPYRFINGSYAQGSFEYILPEPAGSMSSTASDMAYFMIVHLSGGAYSGGRILKEETLNVMHKGHFTHDPALGGMALGFMEGVFNDKGVLFHSGSTMLYNTGLYLLPEVNTGIFISSSGGNHLLHSEVFQEFMDFYYPVKAQIMGTPSEGSQERAKKFTGEYQMNRRSITTDEKINSILGGGIINIDVDEDGYLLVTHGGETNKFVEIEPGVYQNLREGRTQDYFGPFHKIVFKTDPFGRTMLTTDGPMTYSKAPFYSTMGFTASAIVIIVLITISSLAYWIIIKISGLFKRRKNKSSGLPDVALWVGIGASTTILILFAGILSTGGIDPVYQLPTEAYIPVEGKPVLDFIPALMWIFICLLAPFTLIAWWKGFWGRVARVHYSIFTLAVLGLIWIIYYWNLFD
ncbi:serine hydrolase domain-containing protein [Pelotomaculum propionicicum]|uniref:serine hydrolase domain-containing protein n=1 Tax=Pelotomaculum propionicicum TaxID=258475 RepID=UPI003B7ED0BC